MKCHLADFLSKATYSPASLHTMLQQSHGPVCTAVLGSRFSRKRNSNSYVVNICGPVPVKSFNVPGIVCLDGDCYVGPQVGCF